MEFTVFETSARVDMANRTTWRFMTAWNFFLRVGNGSCRLPKRKRKAQIRTCERGIAQSNIHHRAKRSMNADTRYLLNTTKNLPILSRLAVTQIMGELPPISLCHPPAMGKTVTRTTAAARMTMIWKFGVDILNRIVPRSRRCDETEL